MNKNNGLFLSSKMFIILTWVGLFYLYFGAFASANGVYLPYNASCGSDWNNYPAKPSAINHTCVKKRYCSDIKYFIIKVGAFDRCLNDISCGADNDIKYEVESQREEDITADNPCSPAEANGTVVQAVGESAPKKIFKTTSGSKCKIITKKPVIFSGITVRLADGTTAQNQNRPATFYFQTGHNGQSGASQNCFLKSCEDLTYAELEAIDYSTNFPTDSNGRLIYNFFESSEPVKDYDGILLYKFCEPYKYTGIISMSNGAKAKYHDPNSAGYSLKAVYCHEYSDKDVLKFLWKPGEAYNAPNVNNYICSLHDCPRNDGASLSCPTNYDLFYTKDNNYLIEYEKQVLKNISPDPLGSPLRDSNCTVPTTTCSIGRFITNVECVNAATVKPECDNYVGLDKTYTDIINPASYGLKQQTSCFQFYEKYYCSKTFDCVMNYPECAEETPEDVEDSADATLSYFYRPVPPLPATEECPSNNKGTCTEGRVIIKRTLRGKVDFPIRSEYYNPDSGDFGGKGYRYGNRAVDPYDRYKNVDNYFASSLSKTNRKNMCASQSQFKEFESWGEIHRIFWSNIYYTHGKYYDGFWRVTRPGHLPHILPLCSGADLGPKGQGREYTCGNTGYICNAPYWDSYYIKGDPSYEWKDDEPNIDKVSATVCLRHKNSGELGVCGDRECRVDCAFGLCLKQWCGKDRCVTLSVKSDEDCNLDDNNGTCAKTVSNAVFGGSALRFRLQMIDRRVYAFLDAVDLGCYIGGYLGDMKHIGREVNRDSYKNPGDNENTIGGTFRGKLDEYSLFDDNSLTDHNCDGKITDQDVFGEYLFTTWNCDKIVKYEKELKKPLEDQDIDEVPVMADAGKWCFKGDDGQTPKEKGEYHPYCKTYRINNGENPSGEFLGKSWITWGVVQYQGNNQLQNRSYCNVGALQDCRGFYDKNDNFIRESQFFKMSLPLGPDFFYKYATIENSPDLFLPLLTLYSFRKYGDVSYTIYANAEFDSIILDFFRPSIEMKYGNTVKRATIAFDADEEEGSVDTLFGTPAESITANYVFKKTSQLYPDPSARVCLYQVLVSENRQEVKCLKRRNPEIKNFVIKPHIIATEEPTVKAYFHEQDLTNMSTPLSLTDTTKFIPFYDNNKEFYSPENQNLKGSSFAFGQNFPILLESSYCSKLYYSCIFKQKEYNEKSVLSTVNKEELTALKGDINVCDQVIDSYCKIQDGEEKIVQKKADGVISIVKLKKNNTADGAYNQICANKGFEDYQIYVKALPNIGTVVGKCILDNESKQKSVCRKLGYYEFCSSAVGDCKCLDGTTSCVCGSSGCIKEIDCSCSGEGCLTLPEACFLPGFNSELSSLDASGKPLYSCKCLSSTASGGGTGIVVRKATPREMGLCVDLMKVDFCEPVKYYNQNKVYYEGGDGKVLSIIQNNHISNIWRTNQTMYGKYYVDDFEHAEFEKTTDCKRDDDDSSNDLSSIFCLLTPKCYSTSPATKGQACQSGDSNCNCDEYLQRGSCNGFWKTKYNTQPLARCKTTFDSFNQAYSKFELVEGTGCERYSCPTITDSESPTLDEILASINAAEGALGSINTEGKSNGFATWKKYKKGTYGMTAEDLENGLENGHGDDIEHINALYCLQGYAPAGSNFAIKNYIPVVKQLGSKTLETRIDRLAKNLVGYGIEIATYDVFGNDTFLATINDKANYLEFATKTGYVARNHLPMRYCSQLGNWIAVNDIYTEFNVSPYYTADSVFHKPGINNEGFLSPSIISQYSIPTAYQNTYGDTINYSKRYCERLYCQQITENDVGLLSIEDSEPESNSGLTYNLQATDTAIFGLDTTDASHNNIAYPTNSTSWSKNVSCVSNRPTGNYNNYPEDPTNCSDTRGNFMLNNNGTVWRHAGGAIWPETPASRKVDFKDGIKGVCLENRNFYKFGVQFLSSFQDQYNSVNFSGSEVDLKNISLKSGTSSEVDPVRSCNKWGQWGAINNRCEVACEATDVFRTKFQDINSDNKLQNHEITKFYRDPTYRANFIGAIVGGVKFGDKYTGGAKWPRSIVNKNENDYVVGECDATVGKNNNYLGFPTEYKQKGIQFMRNGSDTTFGGAPYRKCLADGTWGPVQNPCINFMTCSDMNVLNSVVFPTATITESKTVVALAGGSITYPGNTENPPRYVPVNANCSGNPVYESGTISKECDITTGEWESGFVAGKDTCVLKTCGSVYYKIGGNDIVNYQKGTTNLYYTTDSGLSGAFGGKYLGNNFTQSCPTGYYCNNCPNNKLTYTCSLNASNSPTWNRKGECVPAICKIGDLIMPTNYTGRSAIPKPTIGNWYSGGVYYAKAGQTSYNPSELAAGITGTTDVDINTEQVYGNNAGDVSSGATLRKEWPCDTGYYLESANGKYFNATCNSTSVTGAGATWIIPIMEECKVSKCGPFTPPSIPGGTFSVASTSCADGTTGATCPNATYTLQCNSGYTQVGSRVYRCNETTRAWDPIETGGWCAKNCPTASYNRDWYAEGCIGVADYTSWSDCPKIWEACMGFCSTIHRGDGSTICGGTGHVICSYVNDGNKIEGIREVCSVGIKILDATTHGGSGSMKVVFRPKVTTYTDRRYIVEFYFTCNDGTWQYTYSNTTRGSNTSSCNGDAE